MNVWLRMSLCGVLCVGLLASVPLLAWGQDYDLDENFPLRMEDAEVVGKGNITFQGSFAYELGEDGEDLFELEPALQYGPLERLELELASPFLLGNADDRGSGDITASALYKLTEAGRWAPSVAVKGSLTFPSGEDSRGVDPSLKLLASWHLDESGAHRVHVNGTWTRNFEPYADENDDGWLYLLGYSYRLNRNWIMLADIWREHTTLTDEEINIAEAGLIYEFSDRLFMAVGAGGGFGDESPEMRASTAFQLNF
ncbi:MAG: transporter [Desulfocurvibacter africanus]